MKNITFRDKNLFYEDEGKGTPVVFIHGFCEDNTIWDSFIKLLPNEIRIIRPDLPGFGRSELPKGDISIDTYAEAVHEILRHEKINKCIVVGHSMGGYTVLAFTEKYPELLNGMALFHSTALPDDENKKQDRLRAIEFVTKNKVDYYIDEIYSTRLFTPQYYKANKGAILQLQKHAYGFTRDGIIAALNAMRNRPDRSEVLKDSAIPVLFIVGKKDTAVPVEKSKYQYALPDVSQMLFLDDVAHMGMFEDPQPCAQAITEFISLCNK